ncbi:MAG: S-layer homology domain-containing protein, partial [Tissierellia bacterium]|nr:S-layer homology domain-containing protein [Tissierellia bacterium]
AGNSVVELEAPNLNGEFEMRLYSIDHNYTDESFVMSVPFTLSGAVDYNASEWAKTEIKKADEMGLIPDSLRSADLTKPITRAEFAAVSVKLYEKMSGITTTPVKINPFNDTNDQEVLKAYNVGITAGVAADKFAPDELLNREQAATMLTRVFKKAFVKGWTLNADGSFTFNYTAPPKFKDDVKISDWAKPSVYFMVTHGIISGVGDNNFAPRATTSAEQAANYASATREQALAISVRMTEKLDSTNSSEVVPVETQPEESEKPPQNQGNSTEQSQESSNTIVGIWQTGSMTGHEYNAMSGTFRYNSGLGQRYNFKDDGTYTSSIVAGYGSMISITGNYTVTEDQITFSNQKGKVSSDYGDTWKEGNLLKDETYYYAFDNSDSETYLLIGLEDALPPLDIETNAASYFLMDE